LKGLGTHHLHRQGVKYFHHIIYFTQSFYPEQMGRLYIINAPWVFTLAWKIVKPWLNEVTLAKIKVLGSNFPSVLQKDIDAGNLPKVLGGACGCEGGCVWEVAANEGFTSINVKAREKFELKKNVDEKGLLVSWEFRTLSKDIGFAVVFTAKDAKQSQTIVPLTRMPAHMQAVDGGFAAPSAGTVTLIWDNSYSKLTSKHLLYRIDITPPSDTVSPAQQSP